MTLRSLSLAGAFVLAATLVAHAADITGKWTAQVPGRDGQTRETTFNFKVDGEKLTGTTTGRNGDVAIADGTVKGDAVAFNVVANFNGTDVKIVYRARRGRRNQVHAPARGGDRPRRVRRQEGDQPALDRHTSWRPGGSVTAAPPAVIADRSRATACTRLTTPKAPRMSRIAIGANTPCRDGLIQDQMDQRAPARRLRHQRHLDQRCADVRELSSIQQQLIDHVGHERRVRRRLCQ
jgi:hypothetical protein